MDIFIPEIAFGNAVFETVYFENKSPHNLENHYKRLLRSSKVFNQQYTEPYNIFKCKVNSYLNSINEENGVLKIVFIKGELHFKTRESGYSKEGFEKGLNLSISKVKRDPSNIFTYFKTFNYGINVLEDKRAKSKGYDGSLFVNYENKLCETSYANIFFRKDNVIYTPHLRCGILKGVMRENIIKFARENGYTVNKGFFTLDDVKNMDEAFISNTVLAVYPVNKIENIKFNSRDFLKRLIDNSQFKRPWNI